MIDNIMFRMIQYFGRDVKQIEHAVKVHGFASTIGSLEKLAVDEMTVTYLAAILHDIGIEEAGRKYNSRAGHYQEIEGPPIARDILRRNGIPRRIVERVCFIIGNHHTYEKIDDIDFRIVVESDILVNISEGNLKNTEIDNIKNKYFTTATGRQILDIMYLGK